MTDVEARKLRVVIPPCRAHSAWLEAIALSATLEGWQVEGDLGSPNIAGHIAKTLSFLESFDAAISSGAALSDIVVLIGEPELDEHNAAFGDVAYVSRCFLSALQAQDVVRHKLPTEPGRIVRIVPGLEVASPSVSATSSARSKAFNQGISLLMSLGKTTWLPELFNYDVKCVDLARSGQPFDITGKPRFLISGPYVTMPKGFWQARIKLGFDDGASRSRFRIDWGEVESYQSQEFYPGQPGFFEITMSHHWAGAAPAEVRLVQLEGVFDGHVTFTGVEITARDTHPL